MVNSFTTEKFIKRSKEINGDRYDYCKVNYIGSKTKVTIICKEHGEFEKMPYSLLKGNGCIQCYYINKKINNTQRLNYEEFISRATLKHGIKYDYSKVDYKNIETKVIIICKEHGEFFQTPFCHFNFGCKKCGIEKGTTKCKSNTANFIEKAIKLHGNKYDYSKTEYVIAREKVIIICKEHGEFKQAPSEHLSKKGCLLCGFLTCSNIKRGNTKDFIDKSTLIHNGKYDYSKVDYLNNYTPVIIICPIHGEFNQNPKKHIKNSGCPLCVNKSEGIFINKIKQFYPSLTTQFRQNWCKKKRFDFCIPEDNIIIELDGAQHFRQVRSWVSPEEQFKIDKYKEKCANENQFSTIRLLQEDVFFNRYDWTKEICYAIEKIKQNKTIQNIYLCKNNEYDNYIKTNC